MSIRARFALGSRRDRASGSAPIGAVLIVGVTVVLATGVGTAMVGGVAVPGIGVGGGDSSASSSPGIASGLSSGPPAASLSISATAEGHILLRHEGGDVLDVRELQVRILVEGEPLENQPPVPFFSAEGFKSGPTGPFNPAADPDLRAGESASLSIAGTNEPTVAAGDLIVVELYAGETPVATRETTAEVA